MISNIVCGVLQIVLSIIVLKVLPIWNPNFVLEIEQALGDHADSGARFLTYWNADMVSNGFLAFIVAITLVLSVLSTNSNLVPYLRQQESRNGVDERSIRFSAMKNIAVVRLQPQFS